MHIAYNSADGVKWYRAIFNQGYMKEPETGSANILQCPVASDGWAENYTYGMIWPRLFSSGLWHNIYNIDKNYTWGHDSMTRSPSTYPLYSDSIITPLNKQWYRIFIYNLGDASSGSIYLTHILSANLWFCDGHVESNKDKELYEMGVEYLMK
jgi:prepilin-type processing-associated H-X9-DG protein